MKKQVRCPVCSKRLYDVEDEALGIIIIKCEKCKKMIFTDLKEFTTRISNERFSNTQ